MASKNSDQKSSKANSPMDIATAQTVAESALEILRVYGVDYIFYNPDTSCVPLTDALAWKEIAKEKPKPIMMLHEFPVVDAAYHYGLASFGKKIGACMIGGVVGTLNAKGAILNAWAGYAPCLILAGMYLMKGSRRRGAHESVDQGGLVREHVKWETEPRTVDQVPTHFARAVREALTEPWGPVYLICNEWLFGGSGHLTGGRLSKPLPIPNFENLGPPNQIAASEASVNAIARLLVNAETPLVVSGGMMGRYTETVFALIQLSAMLGMPVIPGSVSAHGSKTMNFPTTHPMFIGYDVTPYLEHVDLIFVIDQPMISVPVTTQAIFLDWGANFTPLDTPVKIRIQGCSKLVIPQITAVVSTLLEADPTLKQKARQRYQRYSAEHDRLIQMWTNEARQAQTKKPIDLIWLGTVLSKIKTEDTIVCGRFGGNAYQLLKGLEFSKPGTRLAPSAGHMGYGIGGALGVKLARPENPVISVMGDGSFYYGEAGAVFWTANHYQIPVLFMTLNDRAYGAITRGLARYKRWSYTHNYPAGVWIKDPAPRYEYIAKAHNLWAKTVEDPALLYPVLSEAWTIVTRDEKPAFVDVVCESRDP